MIRKKEWEKSFKNVNGREPNEEDYEKALSLGLVREESSVPNSNKKNSACFRNCYCESFNICDRNFINDLFLSQSKEFTSKFC